MTEIWQVSQLPSFGNIVVPLLFSVVGPVLFIYALRNKQDSNRRLKIAVGATVAISAMALMINDVLKHQAAYSNLEKGNYEIASGVVKVIERQPKEGHTKGDIIEIDGAPFVVDYFTNNTCYRRSISHDGYLTDGKLVTVYHNDNCILKIMANHGS